MGIHESVPEAGDTSAATDPIDQIIRYHIQTKHHFNRYARSLGYLDWANQPDPFRRFDGAPLIELLGLTGRRPGDHEIPAIR